MKLDVFAARGAPDFPLFLARDPTPTPAQALRAIREPGWIRWVDARGHEVFRVPAPKPA